MARRAARARHARHAQPQQPPPPRLLRRDEVRHHARELAPRLPPRPQRRAHGLADVVDRLLHSCGEPPPRARHGLAQVVHAFGEGVDALAELLAQLPHLVVQRAALAHERDGEGAAGEHALARRGGQRLVAEIAAHATDAGQQQQLGAGAAAAVLVAPRRAAARVP